MTNTLPATTDTDPGTDPGDGTSPEWTPIVATDVRPGMVISYGNVIGEVRAVEPMDHPSNRLIILLAGGSTIEPLATTFYQAATEPAATRWREQQARARRQRGLSRVLIGLANRFNRDELPPPAWKLLVYCDVATVAEVEQFAATLGVEVETTEHMVRAVFEDELLHVACGTPREAADANGHR